VKFKLPVILEEELPEFMPNLKRSTERCQHDLTGQTWKKKRKMTPMLQFYILSQNGHYENSRQILPPFEGEHLERSTLISPESKTLSSCMTNLKYIIHPDSPTMIGWIVDGMVYQNPSPKKVTHPSIILTLGS
jgi:hypothetical protein